MWRLEKDFKFEASHRLPHHNGKCARLHGHSWIGKIVCEAKELQKDGPTRGMVVDFSEISKIMDPIIETFLDHHHLNDTTGMENPTSEEMARWLYEQVAPKLPQLTSIIIEETCTARCEYQP